MEDLKGLTDWPEFLKECIKSSEARAASYKQQLETINRDKAPVPPEFEEFVKWYKQMLRDAKNSEEEYLSNLIEEKTYMNQGLNPPYFYPEYWKKIADRERSKKLNKNG